MIVVDTSAWIEFLRGTPQAAGRALESALGSGEDIAITDTIFMELLAGARSGERLARLRARLLALPVLRLADVGDYEEAAFIYRTCRDAGQTLRNQIDCLIAVATIRQRASLLHNDRDFDVIAGHTALKVYGTGH